MEEGKPLSELTEEEIEDKWKEYKEKFQKKYADEKEDRYRKECFLKCYNSIQEHNKRFEQGLTTFTMGINQFSDLGEDKDPCGHKKCQRKNKEK